MITDQTAVTLDDVHAHAVTAVRAEYDEQIRGLKAALANLAANLAAEKQRADTAETAGVEMATTIADGIRREEQLAAERDQARRERNRARINARVSDEMTAAIGRDLHDARTAIAGNTATITRLVGENLALNDAHGAAAAEIAELKARLARTPRRLTRRGPRDH